MTTNTDTKPSVQAWEDDITEILADVWNRLISADEGADKIEDIINVAVELDRQQRGEAVVYWRDVVNELPVEAQEVLFVRDNKVMHGAWIDGIFWHSNQKMAAAKWMPLPPINLSAPQPAEPVVKQALTAEREAFDNWLYLDQTTYDPDDLNKSAIDLARKAWQARAALAQPTTQQSLQVAERQNEQQIIHENIHAERAKGLFETFLDEAAKHGISCLNISLNDLVDEPVKGEPSDSPTKGMNLGERIVHVGGRTNAQGYIEFGSPMAVNALIQHALRDLTTSGEDGAFQASYRIPCGEWSSWGHVVCGVKGHEQRLRYLPDSRQPAASTEPSRLGWVVRERRNSDGELQDCFVEAPATNGMAYGLEVLGDDYTGYGDVEGKLKHCQMIAGWANTAAVAAQPSVPDGYSLLPEWKLRRAIEIINKDGDEHGVGADLEALLKATPTPPADRQAQQGTDKVDAELYRWLRDNAVLQSQFASQTEGVYAWAVMRRQNGRISSFNGPELDAAIAAARATKEQ